MKKHRRDSDSKRMDLPAAPLFEAVRDLVNNARRTVTRGVNLMQVRTNFEIGRHIVEYEQQGEHRAEYGRELLKDLSARLTAEFGRGFSKANLEYMRRFFLTYRETVEKWQETRRAVKRGQDYSESIAQSMIGQFHNTLDSKDIFLSPPTQFSLGGPEAQFPMLLSWTHYLFLINVPDPQERRFYEIEAARGDWTVHELRRQFDTSLYDRLALSRDKEGVRQLAREGQLVSRPEDLLKEPYILEFLGLNEQSRYSETDLEAAIIDKMEKFLLELGKGFLFEARQKRFTFDDEHFFIDLVFYNRLLRCYVLVDLKIGKLTHQNLGQMQMYVNYFDRFVKRDDESRTIGIILCKKKREALVEITLPGDVNIHAREYQLYLPGKDELQRKLAEWAGDLDDHELPKGH